jgi:hypothetical protein
MKVTAAPVSNSQLKVFAPVVTFILGLVLLPPYKGVRISQILLQVAMEIVHKIIVI